MMGLRWPFLLDEHQKWLHDGKLNGCGRPPKRKACRSR